jgi:hypothetical protein
MDISNTETNVSMADYVNVLKNDSEKLIRQSDDTENINELLKIQKNHEKLCENIIEQKNDYMLNDNEQNIEYLNDLHNICTTANQTLSSKINQTLSENSKRSHNTNKKLKGYQNDANAKRRHDASISMEKRKLALSQEKNIYKQKIISTSGAIILAILSLIAVLLQTYNK